MRNIFALLLAFVCLLAQGQTTTILNGSVQTPAPGTQLVQDANGNIQGLQNAGVTIPLSLQTPVASTSLVPSQNVAYTQAGDATNGVILNVQMAGAAAFYGVRLVYLNYSTSVPLVLDGVKIAPAAVSITPANSALTFQSSFVTYNGSQTITVPVATTGPYGGTVPGMVITDFAPITSIARTDTPGAPPLLRVASHIQPSASTTTHPGLIQAPLVGLNSVAANPGMITAAATWTGTSNTLANLTTTAGNTATYGSPINPISVIFYYSSIKKDIWAFGDSIEQGYGTASQVAGFTQYMTFNSYGRATQVLGSNFAQQGQTLAVSLSRLKAIVGAAIAGGYKPKYVLWKAWSPNDAGGALSIFQTDWSYTLEAVNYCLQNGITPVVMTSPMATGTSTLSYLQQSNAWVMALPSSVIKVDVFSLLTPGGTWNATYNSGDSVHPNDAGSSAVANLILQNLTY